MLGIEFKEYHFTLIDLLEDDEGKLEEKQAVLDDYEGKMTDLMECLWQLQPEPKTVSTPTPSMDHFHNLCKQLHQMVMSLRVVNETVEPLAARLDHDSCLLGHCTSHTISGG